VPPDVISLFPTKRAVAPDGRKKKDLETRSGYGKPPRRLCARKGGFRVLARRESGGAPTLLSRMLAHSRVLPALHRRDDPASPSNDLFAWYAPPTCHWIPV